MKVLLLFLFLVLCSQASANDKEVTDEEEDIPTEPKDMNPKDYIAELRDSPANQTPQIYAAHDLEHEPFVIFKAGSTAEVAVRGLGGSTKNIHPQEKGRDEEVHRITHLWVENEKQELIFFSDMKDTTAARQTFKIPEGTKHVTPFAHCYIHGVFDGPTYNVAWQRAHNKLMATLKKKPKDGPLSFHKASSDDPSHIKHMPKMDINTEKIDNAKSWKHTISMSVMGADKATPHPQTPDHYTKYLYIKDHHDRVVKWQEFDGSEGAAARLSNIKLPPLTRWVKGYEYCNLHGLWVTAKKIIAQPDDVEREQARNWSPSEEMLDEHKRVTEETEKMAGGGRVDRQEL